MRKLPAILVCLVCFAAIVAAIVAVIGSVKIRDLQAENAGLALELKSSRMGSDLLRSLLLEARKGTQQAEGKYAALRSVSSAVLAENKTGAAAANARYLAVDTQHRQAQLELERARAEIDYLGYRVESATRSKDRNRRAFQALARVLLASGDPIHRQIGYYAGLASGAIEPQHLRAYLQVQMAQQRAMLGVDSVSLLKMAGIPVPAELQ